MLNGHPIRVHRVDRVARVCRTKSTIPFHATLRKYDHQIGRVVLHADLSMTRSRLFSKILSGLLTNVFHWWVELLWFVRSRRHPHTRPILTGSGRATLPDSTRLFRSHRLRELRGSELIARETINRGHQFSSLAVSVSTLVRRTKHLAFFPDYWTDMPSRGPSSNYGLGHCRLLISTVHDVWRDTLKSLSVDSYFKRIRGIMLRPHRDNYISII